MQQNNEGSSKSGNSVCMWLTKRLKDKIVQNVNGAQFESESRDKMFHTIQGKRNTEWFMYNEITHI